MAISLRLHVLSVALGIATAGCGNRSFQMPDVGSQSSQSPLDSSAETASIEDPQSATGVKPSETDQKSASASSETSEQSTSSKGRSQAARPLSLPGADGSDGITDETDMADIPAEVSGAFLVDCQWIVAQDASGANAGCRVLDGATSEPITLGVQVRSIVLPQVNAASLPLTPLPGAKEHAVRFAAPNDLIGKLVPVILDVKVKDKVSQGKVETVIGRVQSWWRRISVVSGSNKPSAVRSVQTRFSVAQAAEINISLRGIDQLGGSADPATWANVARLDIVPDNPMAENVVFGLPPSSVGNDSTKRTKKSKFERSEIKLASGEYTLRVYAVDRGDQTDLFEFDNLTVEGTGVEFPKRGFEYINLYNPSDILTAECTWLPAASDPANLGCRMRNRLNHVLVTDGIEIKSLNMVTVSASSLVLSPLPGTESQTVRFSAPAELVGQKLQASIEGVIKDALIPVKITAEANPVRVNVAPYSIASGIGMVGVTGGWPLCGSLGIQASATQRQGKAMQVTFEVIRPTALDISMRKICNHDGGGRMEIIAKNATVPAYQWALPRSSEKTDATVRGLLLEFETSQFNAAQVKLDPGIYTLRIYGNAPKQSDFRVWFEDVRLESPSLPFSEGFTFEP